MRRTALLFTVVLMVMAITVPAIASSSDTTNQASYWEGRYPGLTCDKLDGGFDDSGALVSDGDYTLVIVKGGPTYVVHHDVSLGDTLSAPDNSNRGTAYGVSHVIRCGGGHDDPSDNDQV